MAETTFCRYMQTAYTGSAMASKMRYCAVAQISSGVKLPAAITEMSGTENTMR